VGEELLEPTRIYVRPVKHILQHYPIKKRVVRGLAHITGEQQAQVARVAELGSQLEQAQQWQVQLVHTDFTEKD
jgi:phosphoribosylaminoimidazole (AIR) synthetase